RDGHLWAPGACTGGGYSGGRGYCQRPYWKSRPARDIGCRGAPWQSCSMDSSRRGRGCMRYLLAVSRWIDASTRLIGQSVAWLIVVAALISAGNARVRKIFDVSSNAWLEMQWCLFAAVFLLAAPWTLALNEPIRIDI